jgi:hypothetical protein
MQKQLEGSFEEAMLKSDTNDYGENKSPYIHHMVWPLF